MDLPPAVPTSADNNTVILWVVGVLVVAIVVVGKTFWNKVQEDQKRMREEIDKAHQRADEANKTMFAMQGGVVMEQQKTQLQTNAAMNRMADAVETMTATIGTQLRFQEPQAPATQSGTRRRQHEQSQVQ
jgi:F0F1-type ATP synthase membrane subunit b/b'